MREVKYPNKPIYKIESLAKLLGSTPSKLLSLAEHSHKFYQAKEIPKANGGVRRCYAVKQPLKSFLRKLRRRIFIKVIFPAYLQGSIKGRSPKSNSEIHIGAKCLITLDIANFFPSINSDQVNRMFKYFFHFSEDISILLTKLVTYQGKLPQGSPVSSDIANIVLNWDGAEGRLVEQFETKGLRYSRYVDDISISSTRKLSVQEKSEVIVMTNSFIKNQGFKLSHRKTLVAGLGKKKIVNGLRANRDKVNVCEDYVHSVYHEIKQLNSNESSSSEKSIASIKGKINHIRQFDPKQANRLENFLRS